VPNYLTPGVYVEEVAAGPRPLQAVGTSTAGFVGVAPTREARPNEAVAINDWSQFRRVFTAENSTSTALGQAVFGFFANGGSRCYVVNIGSAESIVGGGGGRSGLRALEEIDEVAIIAAPGFHDAEAHDALIGQCERLGDRFAILDCPPQVEDLDDLAEIAELDATGAPSGSGLRPRSSPGGYGAFYFPWITARDPIDGSIKPTAPSGYLAGVYARTDAGRGVHKAPANEPIQGALGLTYRVTHAEQGSLNSAGVNCLRSLPGAGIRVWGARTVAAAASEWRYVPVRRLFNMVRETIAIGTRWTVFEPNDATLWKAISRDVRAFLTGLWRDGALQGTTAEEAFFVKCDAETNPPDVIQAGQVVILVGIAPVRPAEFIVFRIGQKESGFDLEATR